MLTLAPPSFASPSRVRPTAHRYLVLAYGDARRLLNAVSAGQCASIEIVGIIVPPEDESDDSLAEALSAENLKAEGISGIIVVSGDRRRIPASLLLRCRMEGFRVLDEISFFEQVACRIEVDAPDPTWFLTSQGFRWNRFAETRCRALDLIVASLLLILTLPLMLLISVLIKIDSRGPVLYRQERVGLRGRIFTLYKFRSMREDAENGVPTWAVLGDPRVTRIGRFIRYTRIDELPQLFNVLRGEMSIIGPRPERPYFVERLQSAIPLYFTRHYVKPGITGWAQVNAPYGASVDDARDKLCYDIYYIKHRKLLLDLVILWRTLRVVVFGEGAR